MLGGVRRGQVFFWRGEAGGMCVHVLTERLMMMWGIPVEEQAAAIVLNCHDQQHGMMP